MSNYKLLAEREWEARTPGWYVLRDEKTKAGPFRNSFGAAAWLLDAQCGSCDWACKHEGWAMIEIEVPA